MQLRISPQDGTPLYQQIIEQVKYLIAGGRLRPGEQLPTIRALADQLRINPNTVGRAYLELEREGLVTMKQGFGTIVAEVKSALPKREKLKILRKSVEGLLSDARHLNIHLDDIIELVRECDDAMQSKTMG